MQFQTFPKCCKHNVCNMSHIIFTERLEHNYVINPIKELWTEIVFKKCMHRLCSCLIIFAQDLMRTDIACHDNDGVLKINHTPFAICKAPIIKNLKQYIKYITVCFFNLVQQNNTVRTTTNSLCKLSSFIISNIAGRRSNETRNTVLLHIFTHINADHASFIIKEYFCKRLGKFCFSNTCRP